MSEHKPTISVVIEGYNESQDLGSALETVRILSEQDYPVADVELILMGSPEQAAAWSAALTDEPFFAVRIVPVESGEYFALKNRGAALARADWVAFTDSDVCPGKRWLASIAEALGDGADASVGPSFFKMPNSWHYLNPTRLAAASVTWGWIVGRRGADGRVRAAGFMDHNLAFRAELFSEHRYEEDLGRTRGSYVLFQSLLADAKRIDFQADQRVVHYFAWFYWLRLHFRYGYEVYSLRRIEPNYPNLWLARTWIFEPVLTFFWHVALDALRWFRVSRITPVSPLHRILLFPLVVALSIAAHTSEALGMACTMIAFDRMARWARSI